MVSGRISRLKILQEAKISVSISSSEIIKFQYIYPENVQLENNKKDFRIGFCDSLCLS